MYALVGLVGSIFYYFHLPIRTRILLVAPAFISFIYTVPLLPSRRRLRDFHYIKIILISIVWSIFTVLIPLDMVSGFDTNASLLFVERALFIFAITIPFDIRDELIDQKISVKTFVHSLGSDRAKRLAVLALIISVILFILSQSRLLFPKLYLLSTLISYSFSALLILKSDQDRHDYYYSGLLDGTMMLILLSLLVANLF